MRRYRIKMIVDNSMISNKINTRRTHKISTLIGLSPKISDREQESEVPIIGASIIEGVFWGAVPFAVTMLLVLLLIVAVPELATILI